MKIRTQRLNELVKREVSQIILDNFRVSPDVLITISRVEVSSDFSKAKVYVSIFPDEKTEEVFESLKRNIYDIQQKLNKKLSMKIVPRIIFVKETAIREAGEVEKILAKIYEERQRISKDKKTYREG